MVFKLKKVIALLSAAAVLAGLLSGCGGNVKKPSDGKLRIVCTLFPQYDFTRAVVGDRAALSLMLPAGAESHSYEPTPSDVIALKEADLFIYIGDEMETWVGAILPQLGEGTTALNLSAALGLKLQAHAHGGETQTHDGADATAAQSPTVGGHKQDERADGETQTHGGADATAAPSPTADGHEHDESVGGEKVCDPHIWTSPVIAVRMIEAIRDAVSALDGKNKSFYSGNADAYTLQFWELDASIRGVVAAAKRREIVFGGRFALKNFTDEYGLTYLAAFDSCTEETEPSAAAVARIVDEVRAKKIPVVFYEELTAPTVAQSLAKETDATPLLLHSCHNLSAEDFKNGETYISLMTHNVENLKMALD